MKPTLALLGAALAACLPAATAAADTPSPGYQLEAAVKPAFGAATATFPGGDVVTFDGWSVDRWQADGTFVQNLASFATYLYPAFVLADAQTETVVIGESTQHDLFVVPLDASGPRWVANVFANYDAAFLSPQEVLVSAATGGFGLPNEIVRVHLVSGSVSSVAHVPGPSGPIALDAGGNLYYATQDTGFPAAPGSTDVITWTPSQVQAGGLSQLDASAYATGFDGASSMGFDPVSGRLYLAETNFGLSEYRIVQVENDKAGSPVVVDGGDWISNLELVSGPGAASFEAYQPADGTNLKYNTTDFATYDHTVTVRPRRPTLSITGPGTVGVGEVTLAADDAPPGGTLYLIYGRQIHTTPFETTHTFPGFLLHTRLTLGKIRRVPFLIPVDGAGHGELTIWNPGILQGLNAYQYLVGDAFGSLHGSTSTQLF